MKTKVFLSGFNRMSTATELQSTRRSRIANIATTSLTPEEQFTFLAQVAVDTYNGSQDLVPVATGRLKLSGFVHAENWIYVVGYNTPYAAYVHEIIGKWHAEPTRSKFLTEAFTQVMLNLISKYGVKNIPDFDVNFTASVEDGLRLEFILDKKEMELKGRVWRRFIGI